MGQREEIIKNCSESQDELETHSETEDELYNGYPNKPRMIRVSNLKMERENNYCIRCKVSVSHKVYLYSLKNFYCVLCFDCQNEYRDYLYSPEWQEKRRKKLEEVNYECEECGVPSKIIGDEEEFSEKPERLVKLQVHHEKYPEVFGTEKLDDLKVLCIECHDQKSKYKRLSTYNPKAHKL